MSKPSKQAPPKQVAGELVVDSDNRPLIERDKPTDVKQAPAAAFRFELAAPFQFAADDKTKSETSAAFSLLARTGDAIGHWYWGRIVHDFAGMSHREAIPVDYNHYSAEPIGVANAFDASSGDLMIGGTIESIEPGDEAAKLIARSRRGIPYQASIYFDPNSMVVEFVPEGMSAPVNGRDIAGPVVIARQWTLRGVAICPHGADIGTECELSADLVGAFSLTWKGLPMSTKTDNTNTPADAGKLSTDGAAPGTPGQMINADARAQFAAELKRFTDRFPNVGAGYFAETNGDYNKACELYIDKLSADVAAATKARDEALQTLAAAKLAHGEAEPIKSAPAPGTGTGSTDKPKTWESMFRATK